MSRSRVLHISQTLEAVSAFEQKRDIPRPRSAQHLNTASSGEISGRIPVEFWAVLQSSTGERKGKELEGDEGHQVNEKPRPEEPRPAAMESELGYD